MQMRPLRVLVALALCAAGIATAQPKSTGDPLPSWNDGKAKSAIIEFVKRVTVQDSADFVPPAERIATFDNDGTLWSEQPMYFQGTFALDRVRAMAADHPEWQKTEPFKSVIAGDMNARPGEEDISIFEAGGLLSAQDVAGDPELYTFSSTRPDRRIDWIFGSPDVTFSDFEIPQTTASDHLPLAVTVTVE